MFKIDHWLKLIFDFLVETGSEQPLLAEILYFFYFET